MCSSDRACHGRILFNITLCCDFIYGDRVSCWIDHEPALVSPDPCWTSHLHQFVDDFANTLPSHRPRRILGRRILPRLLSRHLAEPAHLCGLVYPRNRFLSLI